MWNNWFQSVETQTSINLYLATNKITNLLALVGNFKLQAIRKIYDAKNASIVMQGDTYIIQEIIDNTNTLF